MDCFLIFVVLSTFCNAFNHRPVGSFLIHGRDISGAFLITSNSLLLLASLLSICCCEALLAAPPTSPLPQMLLRLPAAGNKLQLCSI
ncbi:hypothetical protein NC651_011164 [Populus alba x Populus x berolinensis]|nr:hypothetical protein NC651_011164 [Populus alba x Populus x berolinensis]